MRVICIDDTELRKQTLLFGEIYTVIREDNNTFKLPVYYFEELAEPYAKIRFIPLSDLCETEFERNYNKELV